MNAATAATPSSRAKTNITTASHVSLAKPTSNGKTMKETSQSNLPTGAGEQSASVCAFCQASLAPCETYCCSDCEIELLDDPNYRMHGESDERN